MFYVCLLDRSIFHRKEISSLIRRPVSLRAVNPQLVEISETNLVSGILGTPSGARKIFSGICVVKRKKKKRDKKSCDVNVLESAFFRKCIKQTECAEVRVWPRKMRFIRVRERHGQFSGHDNQIETSSASRSATGRKTHSRSIKIRPAMISRDKSDTAVEAAPLCEYRKYRRDDALPIFVKARDLSTDLTSGRANDPETRRCTRMMIRSIIYTAYGPISRDNRQSGFRSSIQ